MSGETMEGAYRLGVDIGGTFTDLVLAAPDGTLHTHKRLSTPDDYGLSIRDGIMALLSSLSLQPDAIGRVVHGTTVATNAVLEEKGARTALLTTAGFRDVLEMRRLRIPEMYTLNYRRTDPLVPRRLRLEIDERMGPAGEVWRPLDDASIHAACERIDAEKVEAVAVCLLHAYANSAHEQRVAEIVRERFGDGLFLTCSSDLLPVIREYERTSTTVINAYLGPVVRGYLSRLQAHLREIGVTAPIQVMKSDGGVMSAASAAEKPAYIVESGPAAGVIGAAHTGARDGVPDCITLDMGGTTAKASIVEDGQVAKTGDYEVGAGINLSSRLVMGGGHALKLPVIDISEIGAGGGSLARIDAGGLVRVGPESAGAAPGPVAYGQGGTQTTFCDAVLGLGYLNPDYLVDGNLALDAEAAASALTRQIAEPLGKDVADAAYGVLEVACGTMMRAVKAVSTYRGRDPRDFALFAFGGNGPVVAAAIADLLDMTTVIIPPHPGVFSAYGLLLSDIEQEAARTHLAALSGADPADFEMLFGELEDGLIGSMAAEGYQDDAYTISRFADLRYEGQAHELTVPVTAGATGHPDIDAMALAFGDEHERTYGHKAEDEAVESVTLRAIATVSVEKPAPRLTATAEKPTSQRKAFFGPQAGRVPVQVLQRQDLDEKAADGPMIVEEYDATCVVPPGWTAQLDGAQNIILKKGSPA